MCFLKSGWLKEIHNACSNRLWTIKPQSIGGVLNHIRFHLLFDDRHASDGYEFGAGNRFLDKL